MLKISAQLPTVLLLYAERDQDGGDGAQNHGIDIAMMKPLPFRQRLGDNRPDMLVAYSGWHLVIPMVIS